MADKFRWDLSDGSILTTDEYFSRLYIGGTKASAWDQGKWCEASICLTFGPNPREWWRRLQDHGRLLPVFMFRNRVIVGPMIIRGESSVCPTCVALRLGQSYPHVNAFCAIIQDGGPSATSLDYLTSIRNTSESALRILRAIGSTFSDGLMFSWRCDTEKVERHRVHPIPGDHGSHNLKRSVSDLFVPTDITATEILNWDRLPSEGGETAEGIESVIDPLVGPIISVRQARVHPDAPSKLHCRVALTGFLKDFLSWAPDVSGSGYYSLPEIALNAAIGEAVERYSGNYIDPARLIRETEEGLRSSTRSTVISPSYYCVSRNSEIGFANYNERIPIEWIEGREIASGLPVYAAAETVFLNYTRWSGKTAFHPVVLAGIAAGPTNDFAQASAIDEIYERDASMRWWYGGKKAFQILRPSDYVREHVEPETRKDNWSVQYFYLSRPEIGKYVTACSLEDVTNEIYTIGFACRSNFDDALIKAGAEAWQLIKLTTEILDGDSDVWKDINSGALPMAVVNFREDRKYKDYLDRTPITQLALHLQYYIDPISIHQAKERIKRICLPTEDLSIDPLLEVDENAALAPKYSFDLSTSDFATNGHFVTRVLCPDLVGNTPAGLVPWNHKRFSENCIDLCKLPMPHA